MIIQPKNLLQLSVTNLYLEVKSTKMSTWCCSNEISNNFSQTSILATIFELQIEGSSRMVHGGG
uniref:Uncharacterized protein n=1 Tax=Medicago truncatula TaxID=3880 RepID=I3SRT0_MEDTR|nr:unknown [Medicago truncatula]